MADVAIKIMFGNNPYDYVTGKEYYFGVGEFDSKISPHDVEDAVTKAIEDFLYEKYGEPRQLFTKEQHENKDRNLFGRNRRKHG